MSFPPVKTWKQEQRIDVRQHFTISKQEYALWMRPPAQPNVVIFFQDTHHQSWQRGVQLNRRPLDRQADND